MVKCSDLDDSQCLVNQCNPATGSCAMTGKPQQAKACQDGNACTIKDACSNGNCLAGSAKPCDDGKACTNDGCDKATGCAFTNNTAPCDDGDLCSEAKCLSGACKPQSVKTCGDGNACTTDSCDTQKGCVNANNASPCEANACTACDQCAAGSCKSSGKPRYFELLQAWNLGYNETEYLYQVAAMPDGGVVVAGSTLSPQKPSRGVVLRLQPAGGIAWTHDLPAGNYSGYVYDIVARADGSSVFVGSNLHTEGGHGYKLRFRRLDATGKVLAESAPKSTTYWHDLPRRTDLVTVAGKDVLLVAQEGHNNLGDYEGGGVFALDATTGALLWHFAWQTGAGNGRQKLDDVVGFDDGSFAAVGWNDGTSAGGTSGIVAKALGNRDLSLIHVGADQQLIREWRFGGVNNDEGYGVVRVPGGGVAAVGVSYSTSNFKGDVYLVRLDKGWNVLWQKSYGTASFDAGYQLVAFANGHLVLAGESSAKPGDSLRGLIQRVNHLGDSVWQRSIGTQAHTTPLYGLNRFADGGLAAVGRLSYSGVGDGSYARTDPFGNTTCQASGDCAKVGVTPCDDSEPCTNDSCDGTNGCVHQATSGACDDGSACTTGETCNSSKCNGGAVVVCDDGEACTPDTCDKDKGCVVGKVYDDGVVCGSGKACVGGNCL